MNVTKKLKAMSESELVSKLTEASPSNTNDSEDMHIDILQVHDSVHNDSDNAIAFSCKEDSCNSIPTIPIAADLTPDLLQADLQLTATTTTSVTASPPAPDRIINPRDPHDLLWWRENLNLDKTHLTLMGFSKGCVVLNQVSYRIQRIILCICNEIMILISTLLFLNLISVYL